MADPLRAFISYSTRDKRVAADVKTALSEFALECFLAHEDLRVSEEWKRRILAELRAAQVFVPLLSKNFKESEWAPQELGFAVARRGLVIIPVSLDGTLPFGFVSDLQGERLPVPVASEFFLPPLVETFPRHVIPKLIQDLRGATSFRGAEALTRPLIPLFHRFTGAEIDAFVDACINNSEIWDASLCKAEYIPKFIAIHRAKIDPKKLRDLTHQITH